MGKDFLKLIVERKKEEVKAAKKHFPESDIRNKAFAARRKRPFFKKFIHPEPMSSGKSKINIIAEIKRASPSKGQIRPDLDPASYAIQYEQGKAAALSVLTDRPFFQGSFDDLIKARQAVKLPVLRKDFLISSYQLYESAVMKADAILLIVRILSPQQLKDYLILSAELQLDALVEVNSEKDLEAATLAGAKLIGINNRNLSSFETDIQTACDLVSLLEPDQIAVAASGIRNKKDIDKNKKSGIYNFLIGESLVRADDPAAFLASLMG